jgi:WD40 repeat protein
MIFYNLYCQGELLEESNLNRPSSQVSSLSWHPVRKIIAVGWTNGELLTWNEHEQDLHEVYSIHKSKINTVKWSHNGHRLITGDQVSKNIACFLYSLMFSLQSIFFTRDVWKFAKLDSPRRLVQFWQNFQTSLVLLIPNCTRHRMITYTN